MFMRDWGTKQQGKMDNCGHFMGVPQCTIRKVRSLEIVAYCGPLSTLLRMSHRYNKKDNKGSGSFQFEDLTVIVSTAVYEIHGILPTGHALDSSPPSQVTHSLEESGGLRNHRSMRICQELSRAT